MIDNPNSKFDAINQPISPENTTPKAENPDEPSLPKLDELAKDLRPSDEDLLPRELSPLIDSIFSNTDYKIWYLKNFDNPDAELPKQFPPLTPDEKVELLALSRIFFVIDEHKKQGTESYKNKFKDRIDALRLQNADEALIEAIRLEKAEDALTDDTVSESPADQPKSTESVEPTPKDTTLEYFKHLTDENIGTSADPVTPEAKPDQTSKLFPPLAE